MRDMGDTENETTIEIETPGVDADAIMKQIRENLRSRRKQAEACSFDLNGVAGGRCRGRFAPDLHRRLRQLSLSSSGVGVSVSVSDESSVPIISSLSRRLRRAFHQLVVFYVNRLAVQQDHHNRQVVRVLAELMQALEGEPYVEHLKTLQDDMEALRSEVTRLTAQVETDDG